MNNLFKDCKTEKDIKSTFRIHSMRYHPDKGGSDAEFVELQDARDKALNRIKNGGTHSTSGYSNPFSEDYRSPFEGFAGGRNYTGNQGRSAQDFEDMFNDLFGRARSRRRHDGQGRQTAGGFGTYGNFYEDPATDGRGQGRVEHYWTTGTGLRIKVTNMDVDHILNCLTLIHMNGNGKHKDHPFFKVFASELRSRGKAPGWTAEQIREKIRRKKARTQSQNRSHYGFDSTGQGFDPSDI